MVIYTRRGGGTNDGGYIWVGAPKKASYNGLCNQYKHETA